MFGIGLTELIILVVVGGLCLAVPVGTIVLILVLHNRAKSRGNIDESQ